MMTKRNPTVQIPDAFLPFLGSSDSFIAKMEGRKLILEPRVIPGAAKRAQTPGPVKPVQPVEREQYRYSARDRRMTPEQAEKYGMSATRLKVFRAIYKSKSGLLARDIMKQCKLPHGSVQQTLNWLRNHRFVTHSVESNG